MEDKQADNIKKEPMLSSNVNKEDSDEVTNKYFSEIKPRKAKNTNIFILLFFAISGFLALSWYAYVSTNHPKPTHKLEVLKPENEVKKIVPDDPGGVVVHGMDKSIYDNLTGNANENKKENLVPAPEEPIVKHEAKNKQDRSIANQIIDQIHEQSSEIIDKVTDSSKQDKSITNKIMENINEQSKEIMGKVAETASDIGGENSVFHPDNKASGDKQKGYYVQIGSFKKQEDAEKTWKVLNKKYHKTLGDISYYIERKDLGDKGIFYRLQAGPLSTESMARMYCTKLKNCGQACFVTK